MATVAQVAKSSLRNIQVQGAGADLEPDEYEDFMFALNNYMLALDAEGVTLGFTEVSSLGDEITIPTGALRGVIANMGIEVAPDYGGIVSEGLVKAAREGMTAMRLLGQSQPTSAFPSTLPIGSGNQDSTGGAYQARFYPDEEAAILAETIGAVGLETGTEAAS